MSKTFRALNADEVWLPPPSVQDFVPAKQVAHIVRETVCTELDVRAVLACYGEERLDFMAVTGMSQPDFRAIAEFRRRHLAARGDLFVQVLRLGREAGLVKLGHVALDATKVQTNASRQKAMILREQRPDALLGIPQRPRPQRQRILGRRATTHQILNHGRPEIQNPRK